MRSHLVIIDGIFRRDSAKVLRIECYQMTKDNLNMAREFWNRNREAIEKWKSESLWPDDRATGA